MSRFLLPLLALAGGVPSFPGQRRLRTLERPAVGVDHGFTKPLAVPCPKCGAPMGQECRRDNRKHRFHRARIERAQPAPAGSRSEE